MPDLLELVNSFLSQIRVVEVDDRKFVVKRYSKESGIIKWLLIKAGCNLSKSYLYAMDPLERMERETSFMEKLHDQICTPRIVLKDWADLLVVREYIQGEPCKPDDASELKSVASLLARVHDLGYALGDTKFHNFVVASGKCCIVDAEQSIETSDEGYMYWDIFVFVTVLAYYAINRYLTRAASSFKSTAKYFLERYVEARGREGLDLLRNYDKLNYRTVAYLLLPIPYSAYYLKIVEEVLRSGER